MKKIKITGKHNIDKVENIKTPERLLNNTKITEDMMKHNKQIEYINLLFLDNEFPEKTFINSEITKKKNSYQQQDLKKNRLDDTFITSDKIIEKLVSSKLKCHYCKSQTLLVYKHVRDNKQWTLDRINNDICHSFENVVISCLECNLKRRRTNYDKFKFTKQLKIKKI